MTQFQYEKNDEHTNRLNKRKDLINLGVNPYPATFNRKDLISIETINQIDINKETATFDSALNLNSTEVNTTGRLILFRSMGKNVFAQIQQDHHKIQIMINRDHTILTDYKQTSETDPKPIKVIEKKIDLGDIVGIRGHLFFTMKGQLTILVKEFTLLTKSLLPLPDKHSGLQNIEMTYRKRWLNLISSDTSYTIFKQRSRIIHQLRTFMHNADFLEVETLYYRTTMVAPMPNHSKHT